MAGRVSFSVRPPASPTYPIHLINLYEQPRTQSTIFDNTKRPFFRHYPFLWKHSQKPIAYPLVNALVALPTNSILYSQKKITISSLTNYQQWPFAYLLAYIHLPYQLIKYYRSFQNWIGNNQICFHQKQTVLFLNTIPFLTDHHQWPLAHLLAYASAALPTNPIPSFHFMKLEKTRDRKEKD